MSNEELEMKKTQRLNFYRDMKHHMQQHHMQVRYIFFSNIKYDMSSSVFNARKTSVYIGVVFQSYPSRGVIGYIFSRAQNSISS